MNPKVTKKQVMEKLSEVYDPELPVNIVDLGLVYGLWIENEKKVHVKATLTSPACPLSGELIESIQNKLKELNFVEVDVLIVWDPPWTPEKMSERAKAAIGVL